MKSLVLALGLFLSIFSYAEDTDLRELAKNVSRIFDSNCANCHGRDKSRLRGGLDLTDFYTLRSGGLVDLENASDSELLQRIGADGDMPPRGKKLTQAQVNIVQNWIKAGAPDLEGNTTRKVQGDLIAPDLEVTWYILEDLKDQDRVELNDRRYLSLRHFYHQGLSDDRIQVYRDALNKLVNSLSHHQEINLLVPIDPEKTIFRLNLSDYLWTRFTWNRIARDYVYTIQYGKTSLSARILPNMIPDTKLPYVRGDWFAYHASQGELYYDILNLSEDTSIFYQRNLNVIYNPRRVGVTDSTVAKKKNRAFERYERLVSTTGVKRGVWESFDFDSDRDSSDILEVPIKAGESEERGFGFQHIANEIIFGLSNGLHGYYLKERDGESNKFKRVTEGNIRVVEDTETKIGPVVKNGISCMQCHRAGLRKNYDDVVPFLEGNDEHLSELVRAKVNELYVEDREELDRLFSGDNEPFLEALQKLGIDVGDPEPIAELYLDYENDVSIRKAASELGTTVEKLETLVDRDTEVGKTVYRLKRHGITREKFISIFSQLVKILEIGEATASPGNGITFLSDPKIVNLENRRLMTGFFRDIFLEDFSARNLQSGTGRALKGALDSSKVFVLASPNPEAYLVLAETDDQLLIEFVRNGGILLVFDDEQDASNTRDPYLNVDRLENANLNLVQMLNKIFRLSLSQRTMGNHTFYATDPATKAVENLPEQYNLVENGRALGIDSLPRGSVAWYANGKENPSYASVAQIPLGEGHIVYVGGSLNYRTYSGQTDEQKEAWESIVKRVTNRYLTRSKESR